MGLRTRTLRQRRPVAQYPRHGKGEAVLPAWMCCSRFQRRSHMNGRDTPPETRGVCEAPSDKQHANTARPAQPIFCKRKRSYSRSALGIDKEEQLITQAAQKARSKYEHEQNITSNAVQAHPTHSHQRVVLSIASGCCLFQNKIFQTQ